MTTPLEVELEVMDPALLVRVCGPGPEGDEGRRLILVSERRLRGLNGVRRSWWLCIGLVDEEVADGAAAGLMQRPATTSRAIHQGLLIHGASWEKVATWEEATRQARVWADAPRGIDRLPELVILQTRAIVFGDDFTRTSRALEAMADSFVADTLEPDARERVRTSQAMRAAMGEGPAS